MINEVNVCCKVYFAHFKICCYLYWNNSSCKFSHLPLPALFTEDENGFKAERINLSIATNESPNDYAGFWETETSPHYIPKENFSVFEFCINPINIVNNLPKKAPELPTLSNSDGNDHQLTDLILGLRQYAEVSSDSRKISSVSHHDSNITKRMGRLTTRY